MNSPTTTVKMKAIDVKPDRWAIWCVHEKGGKPFANPIGLRKWSDDGEHIWFMLDSFNFLKAAPDEELEVVPHLEGNEDSLRRSDEQDAERMKSRPRRSAIKPCWVDAGLTEQAAALANKFLPKMMTIVKADGMTEEVARVILREAVFRAYALPARSKEFQKQYLLENGEEP